MSQLDTNMSQVNYLAYCNAWWISINCERGGNSLTIDRMIAESAVRAGIVFG